MVVQNRTLFIIFQIRQTLPEACFITGIIIVLPVVNEKRHKQLINNFKGINND